MTISTNTKKKAELITKGKIYIPKSLKIPYPYDRSTTGPSSGELSIAMSFGKQQIKLQISKNKDETFSLIKTDEIFQIKKGNIVFLDNAKIIPILYHAPNQAFINLEPRCIYNCAFCTNHDIKKNILGKYTDQDFINLILKGSKRKDFKSIAITAGVYPNNDFIINRMCNIVKQTKILLPETPIGIETIIDTKDQIEKLKKSGSNEIKINLQIPDEDLFNQICPEQNHQHILQMLNHAVEIFGKGKVTSNIIYGLGESDKSVIKIIDILAKQGIVTTLRKVRINDNNKLKIEKAISTNLPNVTPERMIQLSEQQKEIFQRYNLTSKTFDTMCHKCGCCDIVPFWDI